MKQKIFVIGDIHGRIEALKQVFKASKFDYDNDKLIILGDAIDGGFNTNLVINELLKIKNYIFIIGNHDYFLMEYITKQYNDKDKKRKAKQIWINQGGANTLNSYGAKIIAGNYVSNNDITINVNNVNIPNSHINFLNKGVYYYVYNNMLFVHGGFNPNELIENQDKQYLMWDRTIIDYAKQNIIKKYDKVYIGHTTTQMIEKYHVTYICKDCNNEWEQNIYNPDSTVLNKIKKYNEINKKPKCNKCLSLNINKILGCLKPIKLNNLYCLDTGGGWNGKLTIMNINTDEYWQSNIQLIPLK